MGADRPGPSTDPLRLTVPEAAEALDVTVDAIRGRIRRGTLDSERESGTVYVWVDAAELDRRQRSPTGQRPSRDQSELVEELRDRVRYLERRLDEEREARTEERRRHDTLMAQLASRLPAIEAPSEPPGADLTATEEPNRGQPQGTPGSDTPGARGEVTEEEEATREVAYLVRWRAYITVALVALLILAGLVAAIVLGQ